VFTILSLSLAWLAQLVDLYLKLVKDCRSTGAYFKRYLALIYVYPTVAVIIFACHGLLGYDGGNVFCLKLVSPSRHLDVPLLALFIPITLMILSGVALLCLIAVMIVRTWCLVSPTPIPIVPAPMNNAANTTTGNTIGANNSSFFAVNIFSPGTVVPLGASTRSLSPSLSLLLPSWLFVKCRVSTLQQKEPALPNTTKIRDLASVGLRDSGGGRDNNRADAEDRDAEEVVADEKNEETNHQQNQQETPQSLSVLKALNQELLRKRFTAASGLLAFCVLFLFGWALFLMIKLRTVINIKQELESYSSWLNCVKTHFDGFSDHSWIPVCGEQASVYAERYPTYLAVVFLSTGQSLVVAVIFVTQFLELLKKKKVMVENRELVRMIQIKISHKMRRNKERQEPQT
jgi:hypothetical protein